jgi:tRNA 2-thiouridine synthesizing protein A
MTIVGIGGRWPYPTSTFSVRPGAAVPCAGLPNPAGARMLLNMSETLLDVKGMNCPLPVLRANRALRTMAPGQRLRVLATDRAAVGDFQAFCQETGHALLAWSEEAGTFSFVIRRRPDDHGSNDANRNKVDPAGKRPGAPNAPDRDRKDG